MLKNCIIASCLLILSLGSCTGNSGQTLEKLKREITQQFQHSDGTFALAFVSLADTSNKMLINSHEMFHAASTMKTPVMVEVFKQAKQDKFSLSDSITVKNKFYSIVDSSVYHLAKKNDSYQKLYNYIGEKRSIHDLVYVMITSSSNLAADNMVDLAGPKNIMKTLHSYGINGIPVLRGVGDLKAYRQGMSDSTNALGQMKLYARIGRGKAVSKQASSEMIQILSRQEFNTMIPAGLPDSIRVAHKTGSITGVNHDCALVFLPDGRKYVLILLSKDVPNRKKVHQLFANISHEIYKYLTKDTTNH